MPKKFKVACHLIPWQGEQNRNLEKVLGEVREAGYEGVEGLSADSPEKLVEIATTAATFGLHIVNVGGPSPEEKSTTTSRSATTRLRFPAAGEETSAGQIRPNRISSTPRARWMTLRHPR